MTLTLSSTKDIHDSIEAEMLLAGLPLDQQSVYRACLLLLMKERILPQNSKHIKEVNRQLSLFNPDMLSAVRAEYDEFARNLLLDSPTYKN